MHYTTIVILGVEHAHIGRVFVKIVHVIGPNVIEVYLDELVPLDGRMHM